VTGPSTGTFHSSIWVGIDGYGNNTVEQIGTEQDVINGTAVYSAWWEMYSTNAKQPQQPIPWTIKPGDAILAYVQYITSGPHANQFELAFIDSTSHHTFTKYRSSAQDQNPRAQRSTAEWIVEATSVGKQIGPVPDFGSVTFTNASATIDGVIGPINSSSWQSQALNLIANGETVDTTSVLTQAGSSFAVIYNLAGTAGPSDTSANGMTPIGPTVGATLQSGKKTGRPVIGRIAGTGAPRLNASAAINGATGAITASSGRSQAVSPTSNGVIDNRTSALIPPGTSFAVIDNTAGAAGPSGTSAIGTTPIGPTVGATVRSGKETRSPVIGRPAGTGAPGLSPFRRPIGQHERFVRGFLIDPTARHGLFAE
jgi:hypothetical protein